MASGAPTVSPGPHMLHVKLAVGTTTLADGDKVDWPLVGAIAKWLAINRVATFCQIIVFYCGIEKVKRMLRFLARQSDIGRRIAFALLVCSDLAKSEAVYQIE